MTHTVWFLTLPGVMALDLTGPMIDALHLADGDAARLVSLLPEELPA